MGIISSNNMFVDAIRAIEVNSVLFYQQKDKEGYEMLDGTLELLVKASNGILASQKAIGESYIDEQEINTVLVNAMNAMESGDTIMLSDILYFDLKPLLEQISSYTA